MIEIKHPLAIAWDKWLASRDGQHCADAKTLPRDTDEYIKNRLWNAFMAGAKSQTVTPTPPAEFNSDGYNSPCFLNRSDYD